MSNVYIYKGRLHFLAIGVFLALFCILVRLFYLQVWERARYLKIVNANREKTEWLKARRGDIVDRRGTVLATDRSLIVVGVDPESTRESDREKWPELARLLNVDLDTIESAFKKEMRSIETDGNSKEEMIVSPKAHKVRWKKIKEGLNANLYEAVMALKLKGLYGNEYSERNYPAKDLGAHVLGYVNKNNDPSFGIEKYMDFYLRGQDGWLESERDGIRRERPEFRNREINPKHGLNVELTLDLVIQDILEKKLKSVVEQYHPLWATIIVSAATTGDILGLANYPSYDPNRFWEYPLDHHRNRAISDLFEPGSTFKVIAASGALNDGLVTLEDEFDCSKTHIEYRGRELKLPKDWNSSLYKIATVKDIILKSSNRGVAQIAMLLGDQKFYSYVRAFGYGELTGYGPIGEVKGVVHAPKSWDSITITRMPMGHAVSGTPMQVHFMMSVFANDGILMEPRIVRRIFDDQGKTILEFSPKAKRRVVSSEIAHTISGLLKELVSSANFSRRDKNSLSVAGKSGTSQKIIHGKYSNQHHISSFSGFFPAKCPELVVTVVLDDPEVKNTAYGSLIAGPIFYDLIQNLSNYLAIQRPYSNTNL